ncbi:MAG: cardiolipin synthase [Eubacteriales bacterium]
MKNYAKLLYRRGVVVGICILLQLIFFMVMVKYLTEYHQYFGPFMTVLAVITLPFILSGQTDPSYKIAWIIPICIAPIFGIAFYLLFGGNRLSKRLRRKMQTVEQVQRDNLKQNPQVLQAQKLADGDGATQSRYMLDWALCPIYNNTATAYYPSGEAAMEDMLSAIDKAEKYVFLEYFIVEDGKFWGEILKRLKKKAAAGLDVRVLYDDLGCVFTLPAGYYKRLEAVGIKAAPFNPFVPILSARLNNRDHRKFLIVDGLVGFTGGINLADEYINQASRFGYWKDCVIRLDGEAAWSMTVMFLSMWDYVRQQRETLSKFRPHYDIPTGHLGYVQPFCDTPLDNEPVGETVYFNMITKAKKSVYIMTPYLIISDKMISALSIAAKNGVDVRIIAPGVPDKKIVYAATRGHYHPLLQSGVKIYEFTPGFLHGKVVAVDGKWAVVGTINFDFRSLYLHFENGIWLQNAGCMADILEDFKKTFPQCRRITPQDERATTIFTRVYRMFLRIFAPLM